MADYKVVNNVAVITCLNPPVNQLSYKLRVGLLDGLAKAEADSDVTATVIIGSGRSFPAGADVAEFPTGKAFQKPLTQFIKQLDKAKKPVVAAIHGTALGGGLEVALACHYRVGTSRCAVGFPEVLLGLLPGANGTQRLPRVCGSLLAAELICSGQQVKAERAKKINILDEVVDILPNHGLSMEILILERYAIVYAQKVAKLPVEPRVVSKRPVEPLNEFFYDLIRQQFQKAARGHVAPEKCLQAVKAAGESRTFEEGCQKEFKLFMELAQGTQSQALQYVFFAQRQIAKVPGLNPKLAKPIKKVGVIGCGTMGGGILMNFVKAGIPVVVLEVKQAFLDKGLQVVKGNWMRKVKKKKMTKKKFEKLVSLITGTTKYEDLADCDIVIEAVFEKMSIKKQVFGSLDRVCKPGAILATNTSFLDIDEIAAATSRPQKVIGTHFFAPANVMQLLENVRGKASDDETIATVQAMAKTIKKKGVLVGNCDGFVGNRCFAVYGQQAATLFQQGVDYAFIDKVLYDFGMAMGIFQVSDLSGLDIGHHRRTAMGLVDNPPPNYPYVIEDKLVAMNRLGLKTGGGLYDYDMGSRKPKKSALVTKLITEYLASKGLGPKKASPQEVLEFLLYPFINEAFKVLEEGIALRPSDVDVVFVFGYGFPAYRGGPMLYADTVGLPAIRDKLVEFGKAYPGQKQYQVSALLNKLADSKTTLRKYWKKQEKKAKL